MSRPQSSRPDHDRGAVEICPVGVSLDRVCRHDRREDEVKRLLALGAAMVIAASACTLLGGGPVGTFEPVGQPNASRYHHTATVLKDGRVLIAGGLSPNGAALASAELLDPQTGKFTLTGSMTTPRIGQAAALLQDGKVLIASGADDQGRELTSAELYDPATGSFAPTNPMSASAAIAAPLRDGRVLVLGAGPSAQMFDPRTATFTSIAVPWTGRVGLGSAAVLNDGRVLISGMVISNSPVPAWIFDPAGSGSFSQTDGITSDDGGGSAITLNDGRVLLVGDSGGSKAHLYDPASGKFSLTGQLTYPRGDYSAARLADGRVLVFCGGIDQTEMYDPTSGEFKVASSLGCGVGSTASVLNDGRVLIVGGDRWPGLASLYKP
jgi:hypothetical protein